MQQISHCYNIGLGCSEDIKKSLEFAALRDLKWAKFCEEGSVYPPDLKIAFEYYLKAASQGLPEAQLQVGLCYELGKGCPRDIAKASEWYKAAAKALFDRGLSYEIGQGFPRDIVKAMECYKIAADKGMVEAKRSYQRLQELLPYIDVEAYQATTSAPIIIVGSSNSGKTLLGRQFSNPALLSALKSSPHSPLIETNRYLANENLSKLGDLNPFVFLTVKTDVPDANIEEELRKWLMLINMVPNPTLTVVIVGTKIDFIPFSIRKPHLKAIEELVHALEEEYPFIKGCLFINNWSDSYDEDFVAMVSTISERQSKTSSSQVPFMAKVCSTLIASQEENLTQENLEKLIIDCQRKALDNSPDKLDVASTIQKLLESNFLVKKSNTYLSMKYALRRDMLVFSLDLEEYTARMKSHPHQIGYRFHVNASHKNIPSASLMKIFAATGKWGIVKNEYLSLYSLFTSYHSNNQDSVVISLQGRRLDRCDITIRSHSSQQLSECDKALTELVIPILGNPQALCAHCLEEGNPPHIVAKSDEDAKIKISDCYDRNRNPYEWDCDQVAVWLRVIKYSDYILTFEKHDIDGKALLSLEAETLAKMGVFSKLEQQDILNKIALLAASVVVPLSKGKKTSPWELIFCHSYWEKIIPFLNLEEHMKLNLISKRFRYHNRKYEILPPEIDLRASPPLRALAMLQEGLGIKEIEAKIKAGFTTSSNPAERARTKKYIDPTVNYLAKQVNRIESFTSHHINSSHLLSLSKKNLSIRHLCLWGPDVSNSLIHNMRHFNEMTSLALAAGNLHLPYLIHWLKDKELTRLEAVGLQRFPLKKDVDRKEEKQKVELSKAEKEKQKAEKVRLLREESINTLWHMQQLRELSNAFPAETLSIIANYCLDIDLPITPFMPYFNILYNREIALLSGLQGGEIADKLPQVCSIVARILPIIADDSYQLQPVTFDIYRHYPKLEFLRLDFSEVSNEDIIVLCLELPNLRYLTARSCPYLTDDIYGMLQGLNTLPAHLDLTFSVSPLCNAKIKMLHEAKLKAAKA